MAFDIEYDLNICLTVRKWDASCVDFLKCVYQTEGSLAFQVIVVDQAAPTRPAEIPARFPELVLFDNNGAAATPTALNNGLRLAHGRYAALWDTEIRPDPACFEKLIRFMDMNPDAGICGPKIIAENRSAIPSSGQFPPLLPMLLNCRMPSQQPINLDNIPREVDWLNAKAMIVRREVFTDTGLLDEGFTCAMFDLDLCRRAKKHGWHLWHFPDATASIGCPQNMDSGNKLHGGDVLRLFLKKYFLPAETN
ncbi:MAG: glycosyltransferase [Proteobacteria bacterium]|nr:glycosyltransferase [Pseudomonadota bacterium]MBU1737971.1 glycosyltransferase [Pseudomonadota bacterium]